MNLLRRKDKASSKVMAMRRSERHRRVRGKKAGLGNEEEFSQYGHGQDHGQDSSWEELADTDRNPQGKSLLSGWDRRVTCGRQDGRYHRRKEGYCSQRSLA